MKNWIKKNWQSIKEWLEKNLFLLTCLVSLILIGLVTLFTFLLCLGFGFDFIKALGYVALAPFVVYGAYIAGNRWKNDSKSLENESEKLENDREQLANTIFSGAIAHLGHEQKSIRMGGVYTLLELTQKNKQYTKKIFEVLNYHIVSQSNQEEKEKTKKEEYKISTEVQTILDLLFRNEESFKGLIANLTGADLQNANLTEVDLQNADLSKTILIKTDLQNADLTEADLQNANLTKANLQNADLTEADLQNANLTKAKLQNANLTETRLQNADLRKAILTKTNLQNADLTGTDLQNADLTEVDLQNANLTEADLQNANLREADLQNANLTEADLQGANLTEADLQNANLTEANLQNADLRKAILTKINLQNANLAGTIFPYYWVTEVEADYDFKLEPITEAELNNYRKNRVILVVKDYADVDEFIKLNQFDKLNELSKEFINQEGINFYDAVKIQRILEYPPS